MEADRQHPEKKHRPIASGKLPLNVAWSAAIILILVAGDPIRAPILLTTMLGLLAVVLLRFGLLALISLLWTFIISDQFLPAILPWSSWHASSGLLGLVVRRAIVGYAFVVSLGGRPIFSGSRLPDWGAARIERLA